MKISPLKLDHYFVSDLHFTVNPNFDNQKIPEVKFEQFCIDSTPVQDKQDPNKWQISLRIKYQGDETTNSPYSFAIDMVGLFEVEASFPDEMKDKLARTNGATVLYGAAREIIRNVTSSGPYQGMMMPSVSFVESAPVVQKEATPAIV